MTGRLGSTNSCLNRWRIVGAGRTQVNGRFCARLCKVSEISENFFAQEWGTTRRAPVQNLFAIFFDFMPPMGNLRQGLSAPAFFPREKARV